MSERVSVAGWVLRIVLALVALVLLAQVWFAGWIVWYRFVPPSETAFMAQRLDELREKNPAAKLKHEWVPWSRISPNLKRAVIAAEDARFFEHAGLDFEAIAKAREKNQQRGRVVAGGSTITQQLAKNLFLSPSKSYLRKAQEAVIALMLEAILPKERILEIYLNVIEWGGGVFGAEAAARHYFKVAAAQLSAEQAARLAALIPSPRRFERNPRSDYLDSRVATILARMPSAVIP